ncbi:hypothetical protein [Arhodomonas sp. AD133]|uniref:hypothetical protein n=1 Tax=Arhodomonas sp. AD133 TaxID=3415009 RepID=UPI003EB73CB5
MTRFVIHIGMHKTGTTSIQAGLHGARDALAERGVLYPDLGPNHSHPLVSMFCDAPLDYYVNFYSGIDTPGKVAAFNHRHRESLDAQLAARKWQTVLLSGEELGTGLNESELRAFKRYCDRYASSYRIVCYLRDPVGFATSATQQQVQAGLTLEELYRTPPRVRYRQILEKYIRVFGRARIHLRTYQSNRRREPDLFKDFAEACEASYLAECVEPTPRQNKALPATAIHALSLYNHRVPPHFIDHAGTTINPARPPIDKVIRTLRGLGFDNSTPFSLPPAVRRLAILGQLEDIGWLTTQIPYARHGPLDRFRYHLWRWFLPAEEQPFGQATDRDDLKKISQLVRFTTDAPPARCRPSISAVATTPAYTPAAAALANALHDRLSAA